MNKIIKYLLILTIVVLYSLMFGTWVYKDGFDKGEKEGIISTKSAMSDPISCLDLYKDAIVQEIRDDLSDDESIDEFCKLKGYKFGYPTGGAGGPYLKIHCFKREEGVTYHGNYPYEDYKEWLINEVQK